MSTTTHSAKIDGAAFFCPIRGVVIDGATYKGLKITSAAMLAEAQANPESVFGQFGLTPMHALQKQHPGLALLSLSDAAQRVSAASRARLCKGPERIDLDYYDDALETLPPQRFTIEAEWRAFHFQEHITGEFVRWFVRLGRGSSATYWTMVEACDADMGAIVNMCREAAKGVQA